jgi:hypothetical protein
MMHLLLDDRIVASAENAQLIPGPVRKESRNPLFGEEKPWEVRFDNMYPNVVFDESDGWFKCWYNPFIVDDATSLTPPEERRGARYKESLPREMGVCYAVSRDGLAWEKPELGLVEFEGSTRNNIVKRPTHGAGVRNDPSDPDPARRYKMFTSMEETHDQLAVAFSRDGLHWSSYIPCPQIGSRGDTHNTFFRDERNGKYVAFTRRWDDKVHQRIVARTESTDFLNWTPAQDIMRALPDQLHRQTYELQGFPCAGVYLGFVMVLDTQSDFVDCELAWSPDTVSWRRLCPGRGFIPRGPEGSCDHGCIYSSLGPIEQNGELWLYYSGSDDGHLSYRKSYLCLARIHPDRFAGYQPADTVRSGSVVTKPVECTGRRLRINADASRGRLRVAVEGDGRRTLESCALEPCDAITSVASWTGEDLSALQGRPGRLRFELQNAVIYGFEFV